MNKSDMLRMLHNEEKVFLVEINNLYTMLDVKLGLHGADVPITFNYDERALGAYIPPSYNDEEHFEFSLLFIGFCLNKQISAEDRINLYKHEYAHYMTRLIPIPDKYKWQPGIHGSAWKYCCSLIGAVPAEYYAEDQKLKVIDYDAELTPKKVDHNQARIIDTYRTQKMYKNIENSKIKFAVGDSVTHPKFGQGIIKEIEQQPSSVRVHVVFGDEVKILDQKWLIKAGYKKASER